MTQNELRKLERKCCTCDKKGVVIIEPSGKIRGNWHYYGKINLNSKHTSKYTYEIVKGKDGNFLENKNGGFVFKKRKNPDYDPKAKKKMWEYWEHKHCGVSKRKS